MIIWVNIIISNIDNPNKKNFAKDIDLIERVQRQFKKKIPRALKDPQYEDRLKELTLPTLKERRERGDLIETKSCLDIIVALASKNLHHQQNLDNTSLQIERRNNGTNLS